MTPEETIQRIAEAANAVGWQANIGGCDIAGVMVSFLAKHPERVGVFLRDGWLEAIGTDNPWAAGCLTFHRKLDGKITTPQDLRISKAVRDLAKPIG